MKKEERNRQMDLFIEAFDKADLDIWVSKNDPGAEAIRECDMKARAWDDLEEWLVALHFSKDENETTKTLGWVKQKMDKLLAPPKKKSKLERLRAWILKGNGSYSQRTISAILAEIDHLIAEEYD